MPRKHRAKLESSPEAEIEYLKRLFNESDRGFVILTASRLEDVIEKLHRTHIGCSAGATEKFMNSLFTVHAPISTFSAKMKLGFAYGLISQDEFRDLEALRDLRNKAAHNIEEFAFGVPEIRAQIRALTTPKRIPADFPEMPLSEAERQAIASLDPSETSTKLYFLLTGVYLSIALMNRIIRIQQKHMTKMELDIAAVQRKFSSSHQS